MNNFFQKRRLRVLCAGKKPDLADKTDQLLGEDASFIRLEHNLSRLIDWCEEENFDLVLVSNDIIQHEEQEAFELLSLLQAKNPGLEILIVVAPSRMRFTLRAMKARPFHYIGSPVQDDELLEHLQAAAKRAEHDEATSDQRSPNVHRGLDGMIGRSQVMKTVYRQIRQAASSDIPVLLTGETGCGKEVAAAAVHEQSPRKEKPYLPVHIGSLPASLVSDELLGHEKGAFTNAHARKPGCFEQADGGTVFLDEISTMDPKMQVSLLRILEQQHFTRLGGQDPVEVDVRIIAASNEHLPNLVRQGTFREDLYYRLDVMHIELPPLRERHGDVPLLVDHFLQRSNQQFGKSIQGLSPDFLARLETYDWPGNIRELKNVIQRAAVLCEDSVLKPHLLPARMIRDVEDTPRTFTVELGNSLEEVERELIRHTLDLTQRNRTRTAEILGISRRSLYNKLKRYALT